MNPDVRGLDWGRISESILDLPTIDYILASDCFYDPCVFESLTTTIAWVLNQNLSAECLFAYQERNSEWSIDWLLDKWNLQCELVSPDCFHGDCVRVPNFDEELRRHTIHIGVIKVKT